MTEEEVTVDTEPAKDGEDSTGEEESETPRKLTVSLYVYTRDLYYISKYLHDRSRVFVLVYCIVESIPKIDIGYIHLCHV